ncbi:MAG: hypothetical protein QOH06_1238 [Acidobacteriota bacterium]|jgi:hypothetical protein|nr:hypothetical protein [Acidobacteriota bacterium]
MVPELRRAYNEAFTEERYLGLLRDLDAGCGCHVAFRISETPLFLSEEITSELQKAAWEIFDTVTSDDYLSHTGRAVPAELAVPGEDAQPVFLQIDFALALDEGRIVPRLIELQAFPSLYGFQWLLDRSFRANFDIPPGLSPYFSGLDETTYVDCLREVIVGDCDPAEVILLEVDPEQQKTRCDFQATERLLGIRTVCPRDVRESGGRLVYDNGIPIRRIYNRVIFDELQRKGLTFDHLFRRDVRDLGAEWVGHPNWYLRISKFALPFLHTPYAPEAHFVSELPEIPADLENWVLKPLFSFAGLGVELGPSPERLRAIDNPEDWLLQRRIEYAPVVETLDVPAKAEVRMMFAWKDGRPRLINNLVRMSKGKMMGVDFNKNKTWVGGTLGYHPPLQ